MIKKAWPFLILLLLVLVFFNKTLVGKEIFVTPDFANSDIFEIEYSSKLFLSESLKSGQLPLWNPQIASGFPASAMVFGYFNPINLLLFGILPMPLAFNLGFALIFLTVGIFTYLFCRAIKLAQIPSLFAAICFSFSGTFVVHIVHFSLIQTLSFFPIIIYFVEEYLQQRKLKFAILLSFAIGLQILTGFFQIVLYGLIIVFIYTLIRSGIRAVMPIMAFVLIGFLIGAVQLIPTYEFSDISTRPFGPGIEEIGAYPYPPKHLVNFIWPYLTGDPRYGTYAKPSANWGIFWENTAYIGIAPIVLAAYVICKRRKDRTVLAFSAVSFLSLILMLGKTLPAFFIYRVWPMSLFRVPARWVVFLAFGLCILGALGLNSFKGKNKRTIQLIILLFAILNLFAFSLFYNLRGEADKWLALPETAKFLKSDNSFFRIFSEGDFGLWSKQVNAGFKKDPDKFIGLFGGIHPNSNIIWGIDQAGVYPFAQTVRGAIINGLDISKNGRSLLDFQNVKYIILPFEYAGDNLELVYKTSSLPTYYIYQNKSVLQRAYIVGNWIFEKDANVAANKLLSSTFDPKTTVILSDDLGKKKFETGQSTAELTKYANNDVQIAAKMDGDGILVLSDSYYPGWRVYVDGVENKIMAANINSRVVVLSRGDHKVEFKFEPDSFKKGLLITVATSAILFGVLVREVIKKDA